MRVLQIHTSYRERGGEDAAVRAEADLLEAGGHEVLRFHAENPEGGAATAAALARSPWNRARAADVADVARRWKPDVAHVHNTWFALSPAVFPSLQPVPTVATVHNFRPVCVNGLLFRDGAPCERCVGTVPWPGVVHRCYRHSALASAAVATTTVVHRVRRTWERDVDAFVALTDFARSRLEAGGVPGDRVRVHPNVVADPGPRPAPPSRSDQVLYVGRLAEEKGVAGLLEAWATARPVGLGLTVVGDGPLADRLAAAAGSGVELTGSKPVEEVRRSMLSARALVFPSLCYEMFPVVVAEALASGLPVLGGDRGAVPDIVGPALGPDWVLPADDRAAWAVALGRLAGPGGDASVDRAGAAARQAWAQTLTPAHGLSRLEDLYRSVGAGRR